MAPSSSHHIWRPCCELADALGQCMTRSVLYINVTHKGKHLTTVQGLVIVLVYKIQKTRVSAIRPTIDCLLRPKPQAPVMFRPHHQDTFKRQETRLAYNGPALSSQPSQSLTKKTRKAGPYQDLLWLLALGGGICT